MTKYSTLTVRVVESQPRLCIINGTNNNDGGVLVCYGNRDFGLTEYGQEQKKSVGFTDKEVEQIWLKHSLLNGG
jgi:hypothetical protein